MTIQDYIKSHPVVMVHLDIDSQSFQYNYWNIIKDQIFLLRDDFSVGHIILANDPLKDNGDGSFSVVSTYFPKEYKVNMYLGGNIPP